MNIMNIPRLVDLYSRHQTRNGNGSRILRTRELFVHVAAKFHFFEPCDNSVFFVMKDMRAPPTACMDTYRELFAQLDKRDYWLGLLDEEGLLRARSYCEEGGKAWRNFFHGTSPDGDVGGDIDIVGSFRALSERARNNNGGKEKMDINSYGEGENDAEMGSNDASSVVRRELMLALVDRISGEESEIYEDYVLLDDAENDDDNEHESNNGNVRSSVYKLVGDIANGTSGNGERKRPRSPNSSSLSDTDVEVLPDFQSAVPLSRADVASAVPESFSSLLGAGNPVLRSVRSKQRILALRAAALSQNNPPATTIPKAANGTSPEPEYMISCINNSDDTNNSGEKSTSEERIVTLGRAAAALVLEHVGYTHASTRALDVLVDASYILVRSIGKRLASSRERLDPSPNGSSTEEHLANVNSFTSNRATLANAALTDVRGGAAALQSYATYEARKAAAELVNSEQRLSAACTQRGIDPKKVHIKPLRSNGNGTGDGTIDDGVEASSKLNAATWQFGLLPQRARIDILNSTSAHPAPPRKLVCRVLGVNDPADNVDPANGDKMDISTSK